MSPRLEADNFPQATNIARFPKFVTDNGIDIYWENQPIEHAEIIKKYGIQNPTDAGNIGEHSDIRFVGGASNNPELQFSNAARDTTGRRIEEITRQPVNVSYAH